MASSGLFLLAFYLPQHLKSWIKKNTKQQNRKVFLGGLLHCLGRILYLWGVFQLGIVENLTELAYAEKKIL